VPVAGGRGWVSQSFDVIGVVLYPEVASREVSVIPLACTMRRTV
jgi:hypothetical protein